jgi:hypothetical protein
MRRIYIKTLLYFSFNCERNPETRAGTKKGQQKMGPSNGLHIQQELLVDASRKLLSLLGMYAEHDFKEIATGDEFWFR